MADIVFYRGEETLMEYGFQGNSIDKTAVATAVTPTEALAYIQSMIIRVNENVTRNKFVNGAGGRNSTKDLKGMHVATANMSFWLSKDMAQTDAQEGYILKAPIDGSDTDASNVYTIPDTANEYGTDYLKVMTIEAGYNKAGSLIPHRITGAIVNQMTFHAEEGANVLWTYEMMGISADVLTSSGFSGGSVAESTEDMFRWGDILVGYADAGGSTTLDGVEMVEFIVNNNVAPMWDLANATATRTPNLFTLGKRDITGSMRIKLTTAAENGQDLWEDLFGDASGDITTSETIIPKDITITLYVDGTYYVTYTLHDVVIGELSDDLKGMDVSVITVPFTAQACILTMKMHTSATEPTNWAE